MLTVITSRGEVNSLQQETALGEHESYREPPVTSLHAVGLDALPPLHKDPFDRILLAQALAEGIPLVTHDAQLARYPAPVRKV